jgi:hypothetical protein
MALAHAGRNSSIKKAVESEETAGKRGEREGVKRVAKEAAELIQGVTLLISEHSGAETRSGPEGTTPKAFSKVGRVEMQRAQILSLKSASLRNFFMSTSHVIFICKVFH